nr:energy transducer TonB [uncultured Mucilaginibacter sp.]
MINSVAQPNKKIIVKPDTTIYTAVERQPEYPGGEMKLLKDLSKQVRVPRDSKEDITALTRVIITFIVEKNGEMSNAKIIRGSNIIGQQMIKALKNVVWKPGTIKGKLVRTLYSIPMNLEIAMEE